MLLEDQGCMRGDDQEARHAVRTARNGGEIVAMAGPRAAREQGPTKKTFESERTSSSFLNHMHTCSIHKCLQIFSSQAQGREGERKHGGELATVARGTLSMSCLLLARAAHVASTALILPKDSLLCEDHASEYCPF